jgi:hypothetical protein
LPAPAPAAAAPLALSLPDTLFIPGIPAGISNGNVLGDNADTGEPTEDALIPPFIVGSYFTLAAPFPDPDELTRVSTGFNASGIGGVGPVNPSRTYLPKLDAKIKLNIKI